MNFIFHPQKMAFYKRKHLAYSCPLPYYPAIKFVGKEARLIITIKKIKTNNKL